MSGQLISVSGTWMQTVGLSWLVLKLTGSGVQLGAVTAAQFLPLLLLGAVGGLVADRVNKRRLILLTQTSLALGSLLLGILTMSGMITMWMLYAISIWIGVTNAVDNPARQSFVGELVDRGSVANAVSLNAVVMNSARIIGPGIAGVVIYILGTGFLFMVNAASFLAVIVALLLMRPEELFSSERVARARGQLREGFTYVWRTPRLKVPLLILLLVGTLAFEFQVSFPLLASATFHKGAGTYAAFMSFMGIGAVVGGLISATFPQTSIRRLAYTSLGFGALIVVVSFMPNSTAAMLAMIPMGTLSMVFVSIANSTLQLNSDPSMRGRVLSLFTVAYQGSTPIGAPIVGYIGQQLGARYSVAIGGAAALVAGAYGIASALRRRAVRLSQVQPGSSAIQPVEGTAG
jgi:MFS family permease